MTGDAANRRDCSDGRNGVAPSKARHYDWRSVAHDHEGEVVELHTSYNAVAQVSTLPDLDGFLIRVWPSNGTHEYGGENGTVLRAVVKFGPDLRPSLEMLDVRMENSGRTRADG